MPAHDFAVGVGVGILDALAALEEWFGTVGEFERLLVRHGWQTPDQQDYLGQIKTAFTMVDDIGAAIQALEDLRATIDPAPEEVLAGLEAAINIIDDLYNLAATSPPSGLPFPLNSDKFWQTFPVEVAETQIAQYLAARRPGLYATLTLFGVLDTEAVAADPSAGRRAHLEVRIRWERLKDLVLSPGNVMAQRYGWGGTFKHADLLIAAERALLAFGVPVEREIPSLDVLEPYFDETNPALNDLRRLRILVLIDFDGQNSRFETGLTVLPIPPPSQPSEAPAGVLFAPFFEGSASTEIPLGGLFNLRISDALTSSRAGFELWPDRASSAKGGFGDLELSIALEARPEQPFLLLGEEDGTRVEASDAIVALSLTGPASDPELSLQLATSNMKGVLELAGGDGFLVRVFGEGGVEANGELSLAWSSKRGLVLKGSGGLQVDIPINVTVGPLTLSRLSVGIAATEAGLGGRILVTGGTSLGPVVASIEGVGVELQTKTVAVSERRGLFGNLDLELAFRPPTGVGIAIDAGPISGGGFLRFDDLNNRYDGALDLKIYSVAVKAFGVIETRLPGGSEGFSFAIVISAEFTPIQLGLGFTLNGGGGIIGINRRIEEEGLRRAVRDGSLEHLLFPRDVVRDAPQIIHDLVAILPPVDGRYVLGPMAKIGWGTPVIIEAELGIILELPGPRLALLGEVHALLPKKDKGLVTLNLSVAGLLDFPKRYFAIDASLYDSRVGAYPITGDMAMRLLWGENPSFGLAVGGFNPGFQPPPAFPALRRVTVDLGVSGNPSLILQGYFALTSNTAQVGAVAELRASGSGIRLYGRVQFDAIFVFSPFAFEAGISAQVRVTFHGRGIGVHLRGVLTGPSPWRVRGEVCVSILWWDACLSFDKSFGSAQRVELLAINPWFGSQETPGLEEVLGLRDALEDVRNWTPELPPGAFAVVSLAESANGSQPLDPLGVAVVRERVCPLNLQLQRFGSVKAAGSARFFLQSATVNGTSVTQTITFLKEPFAQAQYLQMSDAQKLSAPSFALLDGAIRIPANGNSIAAGSVELNKIAYRTKVLGAPTFDEHLLPEEHLAGMKRRSATGLFGLRRAAAEAYVDPTVPPRFIVGSELFVIGDQKTFKTREGIVGAAASKIEATLALAQYLANHPEEHDDLQVFPKFEMGGR